MADDSFHSEDEAEGGDEGQQAPFSGQLGSPSTTWLNWLSGTPDDSPGSPFAPRRPPDSGASGRRVHVQTPPAPGDTGDPAFPPEEAAPPRAEDEDGANACLPGLTDIEQHPTVPLQPPTPPGGEMWQSSEDADEAPQISSLFDARYVQYPPQSRDAPSSPSHPSPSSHPMRPSQPAQQAQPGMESSASDSDAANDAHVPMVPDLQEADAVGANDVVSKASMPMYARRPNEEYFNPDLQQRRAEDEHLTGRYWPGNRIPYPGSPHEAMFFDELAIALGEVDPTLLAREGALRYVRSSRLPGKDDLGPTDIFSILYYGLGLTLRHLNCAGFPHVLALYNRANHDVFLDWSLLKDPPFGPAILDANSWRRTIDSSPEARLLLAWCAATHIVESYNVALMLGFSATLAPPSPSFGANLGLSLAALSSDTMNRYQKTAIAFAHLLAPADRLWQQIASLRLRIPMGDPEWRARLRAEYGYSGYPGYPGGWQRPDAPGVRPGNPSGMGNMGYPSGVDPVEHLVSILADRNNCPRFLIEPQLDGTTGSTPIDWDSWSFDLMRDMPLLKQRFVAAEQYFHSAMQPFVAPWPAMGRQPESPAIQVRLAL